MMRTMENMLRDALDLRNLAISNGQDPTEVTFEVTIAEHCLMQLQPLNVVTLNYERDRFIGLKVRIVESVEET